MCLRRCLHCDKEVEDRGYPLIQADGSTWYERWVHVPGGYTICYPQATTSPKAEPRWSDSVSDLIAELSEHGPDCDCGGWPQG